VIDEVDIMRTTTEKLPDGVLRVSVVSPEGTRYEVLSTGATLTGWTTPDGIGIVAAYADRNGYRKPGMYLGTTVGLTAGRIRDGRFTIDGIRYEAPHGKVLHYLHSGAEGISFREFDLVSIKDNEESVVVFRLPSAPNLFGASVTVTVTYVFSRSGIRIVLEAVTDRPILCNLTNHSYFNLSGDFDRPVDDHELRVAGDRIVLVDDEMMATDVVPVAGTMFDYRTMKPLMPVVLDAALQKQGARGVDHYFLSDGSGGPIASLRSGRSGLVLDVETTYPGTTVYTTNYPTDAPLRSGRPLVRHAAVAIEPQFQSNGINDSRFHDYTLRPGENYRHEIGFLLRRESR
jgi:aldose 1-epimerase